MSLYDKILKGMPETIVIPTEMKPIVDWYETNGMIGGLFEFYADEEMDAIALWFGNSNVTNRFGVFGIMPDGALIGFWLDEGNEQKVVMLGSEGDSQIILADSFLNFVRLIAIGYDEFVFTDFKHTIAEHNAANGEAPDYGVYPAFQNWLTSTFNTSIPGTGREMTNPDDDSFSRWVEGLFG